MKNNTLPFWLIKPRSILIGIAVLSMISIYSCKSSLDKIGHTTISIYDHEQLNFDMSFKGDTLPDENMIYRLDAGRVLMKKITIPTYDKQPTVTVNIQLTSNGDPWDKLGSMFIIPNAEEIDFMDMYSGRIKLDSLHIAFPAIQSFSINEEGFEPVVELVRFITPFGVGHYSKDEQLMERKPVYIPKWEEDISWSQDITQLLPLLEGEVWIGMHIDTWHADGYKVSARLDFEESVIPNHPKKEQYIVPIVNTTKYLPAQKYYDQFSRSSLELDIEIPTDLSNARLHYIVTGHGGHSEGDEFVQKENIISFNGSVVKQFIPWRDDCAAFRRFNPHAGVWTETTAWKGKEIEERIASSDYSRSNWCPGSQVLPEIIDLGNISKGSYPFKISIPEAQPIQGDDMNFWNVSAYIVGDI